MRRALLLIICLVLTVTSLVPLSVPVAAQQQLPASFVGLWQGETFELPTNATVPVTVNLTGGSLGAVVGTMDLPNHSCGGNMTLQRLDPAGRWVELAVSIIYGTACINGGLVTLNLQSNGSVYYEWRHATIAVTATGTLMRSGGAISPPAALIPATVAPVLPTPIATSPPISAQLAPVPTGLSGGVVIDDDFSDPASSLFATASIDLIQRVSFDSGELVFERLANPASGFNIAGVPGPYNDTAVSASVRLPNASPVQYVGLGCRVMQSAVGPNQLYALMVFPSLQTFGLVRADNGQSTLITEWTTSPAINPIATASNRLELTCAGETIAASINGVEVGSVRDTAHQSGGVVLIVGNNEVARVEARFDDFEVVDLSAMSPAPVPTAIPAPLVALPVAFFGRWEGTVVWNNATLPVVLDLNGGGVGEVVGTVEYALYGSAGPKCGANVSLVNMTPDRREIALEGLITYDATVCLVDATVQITFQDTGAFGYLWNHPALTLSGTGTLTRTSPTN